MTISEWVDQPSVADGGAVVVASVNLPTEIRRASDNGDHRLWVEFHGDARTNVDGSFPVLNEVLRALSEHVADAFRLAPPEWRHHYVDTAALDLTDIWLDTIELDSEGAIRLDFDFGDLDLLVLHITPTGPVVTVVK